MITDRLTAKVMGLLLVALPLLIAFSSLLFSKPEVRQNPAFLVAVLGSSVPPVALGVYFFRKASRMKEDGDEEDQRR
jgi:hypothetical protein